MPRLVAHVSGKVQRVGYRSMVVMMARTLGLKGFVQNLANGLVFIIAEGSEEDLALFVKSIRVDSPPIKVEDIFVDCKDAKGEFGDFFKMKEKQERESLSGSACLSEERQPAAKRATHLAPSYGLEKIVSEIESSYEEIELFKEDANFCHGLDDAEVDDDQSWRFGHAKEAAPFYPRLSQNNLQG